MKIETQFLKRTITSKKKKKNHSSSGDLSQRWYVTCDEVHVSPRAISRPVGIVADSRVTSVRGPQQTPKRTTPAQRNQKQGVGMKRNKVPSYLRHQLSLVLN